MEITSEDLKRHLSSLPQELYDGIYERIFTADDRQIQTISRAWHAPHLLHVDRSSRQKFARSYFTTPSAFYMPHSNYGIEYFMLASWLAVLDDTHADMIQSISLGKNAMNPVWFLDLIHNLLEARLGAFYQLTAGHSAYRLLKKLRMAQELD
ncbi:uncharacterized protein CLAFUR5_10900 [Fulvia fulva]|uniref:Uncharacterized protein n=1 Tax=Passalora fulva TaxID=5499 RepID=A0A9Q8PES3_PASFU|nr:uncharacterized protein CLAFUR5_10900 [Fulvia fulva]UJO21254.1 hypothetical protein CLAFUR5_10900 [Fulvia fulva]